MNEPYYVTTPIYYVNDVPHLGHAYTTVAADVLARFFRSSGRDVHFLTGTDEHGIKIVKAAAEKDRTPQELADEVVEGFRQMWPVLGVEHDDFIRTTEPRHERRVQKIITLLLERDDVYLGSYEGWYDEGQEEYVTESTARENDFKSPISGRPLVRYSEQNWFFRLGKYVPKLIEHLEANPGFVKPEARYNEVLSKLRQGVDDLCISRNRQKLPWGVEMPNDPEHVVYVWVDALSNYCTALGIPDIGEPDDAQHARYWPAQVHLIGKDILWFHAVYWPCLLMALNLPLPECVFAHGWWTAEGKKMSKSLGNFIGRDEILAYCEEYSRDVLRYYLLRAMVFGADGDFSRDMFRQVYNNDLANGVGNLLSRTVKMIGKYLDGQVPPPNRELEESREVLQAADALAVSAEAWMADCAFHQYLNGVMNLVDATNRFIDTTEPFRLAKEETQKPRLESILGTCAESLRLVLLYLRPVLVDKADAGLALLGRTVDAAPLQDAGRWGADARPAVVTAPEPLFPRMA